MASNNKPKLDKSLLEAISKDDPNAFDSLFTAYYPKIKTFLAGFLDSKEEAEDLAQDVFVKLWQNRSILIYVENLNAYLYRMAKNTLFDYIEKSNKIYYSNNITAIFDIPTKETLEELLFAEELNKLIDIVIDKMPTQRKNVFIMSRKEGLLNDEIATRLNISKRTVETHISAALTDIRKIIPLLLLFF
ncbi:MAG: RNA polymerase sigma-70 factor [Prevotella sp.]|nr:RNA polymerase sigma-70 factor [Prevotella sp.]